MSRTPTFPVLTVLAFGFLLFMPGLAQAEDLAKTFDDKNFKLTLPSDTWGWMEVGSGDQAAGFVARAFRRAAGTVAVASVRVVPTNGLSLSEQTQEVRDGMSGMLSSVEGARTGKGKLSGIEGSLVIVRGKDNRDVPRMWKVYTIEAQGKFHQLFFALDDGAEVKQAATVDALRRGYRLLKGAGPMEVAPEGGAVDGGESEDEPEEGGDDEKSGAPKREGNALIFPSHNVKWTLPEDSIFEFASITDDESMKQGILCWARARIEHPPVEGSKNEEGRVSTVVVRLEVGPPNEGWTPQLQVNSSNYQSALANRKFDEGKCDYGRLNISDEIDVGNVSGAALQMVGQKEGKVRFVRVYAVGLKGEYYIWEATLEGGGNVNSEFKRPLKELMAGVTFLDTAVWIRGPIAISGIPSHDQARGTGVGEVKESTSMGFKAKKPKEMAKITFKTEHTGGKLRLAWETRDEEKSHYLYFDVQTWTKKSIQGQQNVEQDLIGQREGQWKEHAESPNTIKKGKTAWFKASYGRGKGFGYEFTGYLNDMPFIERGFLVVYKKHLYWVRYQLGGENAEKVFAKTMKALKKAIKFV